MGEHVGDGAALPGVSLQHSRQHGLGVFGDRGADGDLILTAHHCKLQVNRTLPIERRGPKHQAIHHTPQRPHVPLESADAFSGPHEALLRGVQLGPLGVVNDVAAYRGVEVQELDLQLRVAVRTPGVGLLRLSCCRIQVSGHHGVTQSHHLHKTRVLALKVLVGHTGVVDLLEPLSSLPHQLLGRPLLVDGHRAPLRRLHRIC
mmetsp:Transcript_10304/g.26174  ORF Transcript_10304/g.26174 Transcript_10304/m.26174 type:complete len:203 (-) Transcript_10304:295-903(-)